MLIFTVRSRWIPIDTYSYLDSPGKSCTGFINIYLVDIVTDNERPWSTHAREDTSQKSCMKDPTGLDLGLLEVCSMDRVALSPKANYWCLQNQPDHARSL